MSKKTLKTNINPLPPQETAIWADDAAGLRLTALTGAGATDPARPMAREIPVVGVHAPAWVDAQTTGETMPPELEKPLPLLPGLYRAELAGVREVYDFLAPACEWVFLATVRLGDGVRLPWQVPVSGQTGVVYGPAERDLTGWIDHALGCAVYPNELEAIGLAAFVGETFEVEVAGGGRVVSCRLMPGDRATAGQSSEEARGRILAELAEKAITGEFTSPTVDQWWTAATRRYRSGEYCRIAWQQMRPRKPRLVVKSGPFDELILM